MTTKPTEFYLHAWNTFKVNKSVDVSLLNAIVAKIRANSKRYAGVSAETGFKWFIIGILNQMECGSEFTRHLCNGDPLRAKTIHSPQGHIKGKNPPYTWEESAIATLKNFYVQPSQDDQIDDYLWFFESWNGRKYLDLKVKNTTPPNRSPYLWAGTDQYIKGKFVADGKFDPNAVSEQIGVAILLKVLLSHL